MGASASQIASARALAASRGYNPDLVDEDNADRANSAFPSQGGSAGGGGGRTISMAPPAVGPWNNYGNPTSSTGTPPAAPGTPFGTGLDAGTTNGTPAAGTPAVPASVQAMNKVAMPGIENAAANISLAAGAASAGGSSGGEATNALSSMTGMLRALGQRRPPTQSQVLGRKAY